MDATIPDVTASPTKSPVEEAAPALSGVAIFNCNPGNVESEFAEWLTRITVHNLMLGEDSLLRGVLLQPSGACIASSRDAGMAKFQLEMDAEWLLWLDSDLDGDADIIQQLLEHADPINAPIVSGLYITALDDAGVAPCVWDVDLTVPYGKTPFVPWDAQATRKLIDDGARLVECGATGAGCLLIHRSVIMAMALHYGSPSPWFHEDIVHGVQVGEDFAFCMRARAIGYKIHVDLGIRMNHKKTIFFSPDHLGTLQVQNRSDKNQESPT